MYCNTSYVSFQWAACQQIGMLEVFSWLQRHSLSYEENTKLSFFRSENTDRYAERIDMQKFISKSFQAESGFFIKIFMELIN